MSGDTKRLLRWWPLAALVAGACTPSDLSADAGVVVTGRLDGPDGGAVAGVKTVLIKQPDLGEAIGGFFEVYATLGLACLNANAPVICENGITDVTSASGEFSFSLTGAQTQGSVGNADTFALAAKDAPGAGQIDGASVTEEFIINTTDLVVPDLRLWEPDVVFASSGNAVAVTFGALPNGAGSGIQTGVTFAEPSVEVWGQNAVSGTQIDARLLEDTSGEVAATATATGQATATSVSFIYHSGAVAFSGTAGPPPSRHAACFVEGAADGGAVPLVPCALTDGDFSSPIELATCSGCNAQELNNWAYVDLGAARAISLVVVRGTAYSVVVETSTDAASWTALAGGPQSGLFSVGASGTVRYVRVRASAPTSDISGLTEVSVW